MFKLDFSTGSFLGGLILTFVLIVLDKAGKLKGPMLLVLLGVAALLTLPLVLNLPWVSNSQGLIRVSRGLLMFFSVGLIFSLIAVWISPTNVASTQEDKKPAPAPKPIFKVEVPAALPGVVELDVNMYKTTNSTLDSIFPVAARFQNSPELKGFSETDKAWARIVYKATSIPNLELARVNVGCWIDQPVGDVDFPFGTARYLLLGGWHIKGKQPLSNEFRVFEYSRELHRGTEKTVKIAGPQKLIVEVTLTSSERSASNHEYRFELNLLEPAIVQGRLLSGRYSIREIYGFS